MRLRVLYANGRATYDIFWLEHNGTDVYCGPTGVALKRSYHGSGKVHLDVAGEREHHKWHSPLNQLRGGWCMLTTGFLNAEAMGGVMNWSQYGGKKGDALLTVDGRSIPLEASVQVDVGLCEPLSLAGVPQLGFQGDRIVRQLLLYTDTSPWVYAAVIW